MEMRVQLRNGIALLWSTGYGMELSGTAVLCNGIALKCVAKKWNRNETESPDMGWFRCE
jgi:hypothetical protein